MTAVDEKPKTAVMLHFGETDASIPKEDYEKVMKAHPNVPTYIYPAGHGFVCDERGSYHAESSKLARERTMEFFKKHLG
jgi:carboxymethylenebutenolidase